MADNISNDAIARVANQIESHQAHLEKDYLAKSESWSAALTKFQAAEESLKRYEQKADAHKRLIGQSNYNPDGSMAFLSGFQGESHLRPQCDVIRDLQRYCLMDMLKLRQFRIESLLQEFCDGCNHELLTGVPGDDPQRTDNLRRNLWSIQNILGQLRRNAAAPLSKSDVIRKVVRWLFNLVPNPRIKPKLFKSYKSGF